MQCMPLPTIAPLVHAAGFALGTLLAIILWSGTRGNLAANRWLAAYVACLALLSGGALFYGCTCGG
jgi:hypothetical protein